MVRKKGALTSREALASIWFFWGLYAVLVGMPSVISLIQSVGLERDLVRPLQMIIDGYGQLFEILGMLIEPWAEPIYSALGEKVGLAYDLHIYWRALFVILMLYPISVVRFHFNSRPWGAAGYGAICTVVTLAAALATGFVPAYIAYDAVLWAGIAMFQLGKLLLFYGRAAGSREAASAGLMITSPLLGTFLIIWLGIPPASM